MIKAKVSALPNDKTTQRWKSTDLARRMEEYNQNNHILNFQKANQGEGQYPLLRLFQENTTDVFEVDCDGEQFEMFESMRIYIERNGRPYNYLEGVWELNEKREEHLNEEEEKLWAQK